MAYYLQNTWKSIQRTKNEWFKLLLMILLLTSSISVISQQSEPLKHHYKVAYRPQFEPYEFSSNKDKPDGFMPNLLVEIGKSVDITFEFVAMTAREEGKAIEKSEVDLISIIYSPERDKNYGYSNPCCQISEAIFQKVGNENVVTLKSLTGHTIGFVENDRLLDTFAIRTDFTKHIVTSKLDGFLHLRNGKIDAMICGEMTGMDVISEYELQDIKMVSGNLFPRQYVFATRKSNEQLILLLNKQLANLQTSGKLLKLTDKWLSGKISTPSWIKKHQTLLVSILAIFAGIVIILLFWNWMLRRSVNEKTKSIKDSEARYSTFFENMGEGVGILDKDEVFVFVNPTAEKIFGVGKGELLGTSLNNFLHGDSFEKNKNETQKRSQGESSVYEQEIVLRDGSKKVILITATPNFVDGKFVGTFGIFRDITERKKGMEALQESEEKYRFMFDNNPQPMWIYDFETLAFLEVNHSAINHYGYSREEFLSMKITDIRPVEDIPELLKDINTLKQSYVSTGKWRHFKKNGEIIFVEITSHSLLFNGRKSRHILVNDITDRMQAEEALRESEALYRNLVEVLPDGVYKSTHDGKFVDVNPAMIKMLGYASKEELMAIDIKTQLYFEPADRESLALEEKFMEMGIYRLKKKDGSEIWIEDNGWYNLDDNGNILFHEGIMRDITDRKKTEEVLRESEERFRTVTQSANDAIITTNSNGIILDWNRGAEKIFGYTAEEITGKYLAEIMPQRYIEPHNNGLIRIEQGGTHHIVGKTVELHGLHKNGNEFPIEFSLANWETASGKFFTGIIRDITDRKLAEEKLQKSYDLLNKLAAQVPGVVYQYRLYPDGHSAFPYSSQGMYDIYEVTAEEVREDASPVFTRIHPDDYDSIVETITESARNQTVYSSEFRVILPEQGLRWRMCDAKPELLEDGSTLWYGIIIDITERKLVEEALRESEIKYRELVDNSPDAIAIYEEGKIVFVNNECVRLMAATSAEELIGKSVIEFVHPDFRALAIERMKKAVAERVIFILPLVEEKFIRLDGIEIDVEVKAMSVQLENKLAVQLIVRDITERKHTEKLLEENREEFKELFDYAPIGYHEIDAEGRIVRINQTELNMLGYSSDELIGQYFWSLITEKPISRQAIEAKLSGNLVPLEFFEREFRKKDGTMVSVLLKDKILKAKDGRIIGIRTIVQDITERKQVELELEKSHVEFKELFENAPIGYHELDAEGRIVRINQTELNMLGYSNEELIGKFIWSLSTDETISRLSTKAKLAGTLVPLEFFEREFRRKDGTIISVLLKDKILKADDGRITGIRTTLQDITERKKAEVALNDSQQQLKKFASHLQNVREEERISLAREIHDELGQILIAVKIDVGMLKQKVLKNIKETDTKDILTNFDRLFGMVDNTINTTRKIMTDLRPDVLDLLGFIDAVKLYVDQFQARYHIDCQFESEIEKLELNMEQSVPLFRILQEALTNVAKHAKATVVKVNINILANKLVMEIVDNGVGFNDHNVKRDSYGLIGMKERAFLLDSELVISGYPGKGVSIKIEMPYSDTISDAEQLKIEY